LLNLHGVPKPIYRAYELLHHLGTERLSVAGAHETVDAWVVRDGRSATVLLTDHAQPRAEIARQRVEVSLTSAQAPTGAYIERIDEDHANAPRPCQAMGDPEYLSPQQVEQLQAASRLAKEPLEFGYQEGRIRLEVDLPPHAVAAITLAFPAEFLGKVRP
jgi:xylan 1,4-beta-xylosidase